MTIGVLFGPYNIVLPCNNYSLIGYPWNIIGYMKLFWSKIFQGFHSFENEKKIQVIFGHRISSVDRSLVIKKRIKMKLKLIYIQHCFINI